MDIEVRYRMSEKYVDEYIAATGEHPNREMVVRFAMADPTIDERRIAFAAGIRYNTVVVANLLDWSAASGRTRRGGFAIAGLLLADHILSKDEIFFHLAGTANLRTREIA